MSDLHDTSSLKLLSAKPARPDANGLSPRLFAVISSNMVKSTEPSPVTSQAEKGSWECVRPTESPGRAT
ncbi:MAG: hypothetical protein RBS38_06360 [Bacteroidales bacterium]|nr:hypothetical protein [Bacteroidales bacterium]